MAFKIAIVVSEFNSEITSRMEKKALEEAKALKAEVVKVIRVPGAFDIPLIAQTLAKRKDVDAVVALGAIIKGETQHDEAIAYACIKLLGKISLKEEKPVSLGVIGPGASYENADARAEEYAKRAVMAAIRLIKAKKEANE